MSNLFVFEWGIYMFTFTSHMYTIIEPPSLCNLNLAICRAKLLVHELYSGTASPLTLHNQVDESRHPRLQYTSSQGRATVGVGRMSQYAGLLCSSIHARVPPALPSPPSWELHQAEEAHGADVRVVVYRGPSFVSLS
ncbi:unnamed protein product [Periconia digitata]|uniref:Uncharacterized protein n=1 Tax=Periconia digitata TaxID=1303443 RepID=A0A9W4XP68_9PLEO|nr:unnamed protein product [Periconia digitata]